jgi:hypothetical protein
MRNEGHIVTVTTFNVTADDFTAVARSAALTLQRRVPTISGFVEGMLLTDEGNNRIIAVTEWKSRQSWAASRWDEDVERVTADLFEGTASYDLEFFFPLVKVKSAEQ